MNTITTKITNYKLITNDGDVWIYSDLEAARRDKFIFGGTICEVVKEVTIEIYEDGERG